MKDQLDLGLPRRRRKWQNTKVIPAKSKFGQVTHGFLFEVTNGDGSKSQHEVKAKVRLATQPVSLVVTQAHVEKAIQQNGVGNSAKCAMAVCCYDRKADFPHPVEGHVDWAYSRAWVVSKTRHGLPSECVCYEHHSDIARNFDTEAGLQRLLARILKSGSITVNLLPYRKRSDIGRTGRNRKGTGVRKKQRKGARLRYDVVHLGSTPPAK